MDQQTVQHLITAITAVVAALGGAGLTAYINHKNTLRQLEASKEQADQQWSETRAIERERWTRDKKTESYARFLRTASPLYPSNFLHSSKGAPATAFDTHFDAAMSDVIIFGSQEVVVATMKYRTLFSGLARASREMRDEIIAEIKEEVRRDPVNMDQAEAEKQAYARTLESTKKIQAEMLPQLVEEFSVLANLMRNDCGIEGDVGRFSVTQP